MDTGPVYRAVCLFTSQRWSRYQIILLGDRCSSCVNNLPKVVTRQCTSAELNLHLWVTSGLQVRYVTVRLPSHTKQCTVIERTWMILCHCCVCVVSSWYSMIDSWRKRKLQKQPRQLMRNGRNYRCWSLRWRFHITHQLTLVCSFDFLHLFSNFFYLISSPGSDSLRSGLKFYCRCFLINYFLFQSWDIQDASADRCEILHSGQH